MQCECVYVYDICGMWYGVCCGYVIKVFTLCVVFVVCNMYCSTIYCVCVCSLVYSMRGVVLVSVYSVYVGVVHVPGLSTSSFLWPLLTGTESSKSRQASVPGCIWHCAFLCQGF